MFKKRHVLSMREFSREEIDSVLDLAAELEPYAHGKKSNMLSGKILALLFFEPSTRTRMSFETAMKRLGGGVINLGPAEGSSISKGESLADTVRVIGGYADALVIRHPKEGSARLASEFSPVPVLNAGDGAGHHPTQTLLDLYTIKKESSLEDLHIALVGDLKYGRTVHSLAYALSLYGADITLVSPPSLGMPDQIKSDLSRKHTQVRETSDLSEVIKNVDVLYMTRIQRERFPDPMEYKKVAKSYRITPESIFGVKENLIIMHPLPRVDEIAPTIDSTKHAMYFKQSFYGVTVRMALLKMLMDVECEKFSKEGSFVDR
jgi:aspartate carbamoyltransferase catalytic subunit